MRPTLEQALGTILGNGRVATIPPSSPLDAADTGLIEQALETFEKGESALRQGNWAEYGRYQQQLREILQQLEQN
jgi:hypothetical protein